MVRSDFGVNFNGRNIAHPGSYDRIDASAMIVNSGGSSNIPIVIGESNAGKSGEVIYFTGSTEARKYLVGGDLSTALDLMFTPSPEGDGGSSIVGVLITNATVQASTTTGSLVQTALEYGEGGNRIQTKIENGTITTTKKYTAYRWDTNQLEVYDNVGAVMTLSYTGSSAYAVIDVTHDGDGNAILLTTKIGANAGSAVVDLSLDLTKDQFATIQNIIDYINTFSGYVASPVSSNNMELPSSKLDIATAGNIKGVSTYIMSVNGDLIYQVNRYSELVHLELVSSVTNHPYTYLVGGVKGVSPSSWTTYFDTIKKEFSSILVVLSSSVSIQAEALAHIGQMELRNQKQTLFTGGALGISAATAKSNAAAFNSSRAIYCYPGIYYAGYKSGKTALPSYFTAAMVAGRVSGRSTTDPVTFNYFSITGLEVDLIAGDPVIDDLITSGVCTFERVQNGGIRLVQGITTYIGANNILYREISVRRGADALSEKVRSTLESKFAGKKGLKATPSSVTATVIDDLEQSIKDEDIVGYRDITVSFVGTIIRVDYMVAPVNPINFILVTSHFVPELT